MPAYRLRTHGNPAERETLRRLQIQALLERLRVVVAAQCETPASSIIVPEPTRAGIQDADNRWVLVQCQHMHPVRPELLARVYLAKELAKCVHDWLHKHLHEADKGQWSVCVQVEHQPGQSTVLTTRPDGTMCSLVSSVSGERMEHALE